MQQGQTYQQYRQQIGNYLPHTHYYLPSRTFGCHTLQNLLLFFQPQTIEEKLLLIEAYIFVNDFNSADSLIEQLYEDVKNIDIHASYRPGLLTSIQHLQAEALKLRGMMKNNSLIIQQLKNAATHNIPGEIRLYKIDPYMIRPKYRTKENLLIEWTSDGEMIRQFDNHDDDQEEMGDDDLVPSDLSTIPSNNNQLFKSTQISIQSSNNNNIDDGQ